MTKPDLVSILGTGTTVFTSFSRSKKNINYADSNSNYESDGM